MRRGFQTMIVFYGTISLAAAINFGEITALVLPVTMFYTIFDTLQLQKRINEGQFVEDTLLFEAAGFMDSQGNLVGFGLILLGVFALLNNLFPRFSANYYYMEKLVPPLLILGIGIYILVGNSGRRGNS